MKILLLTAIFMLVASGAESRTWRVNTAGTGDAPTLHAAMDSAAAFDIVLVEAGQYFLGQRLRVKPGVTLEGESGPAHTLLYGVDIHDASSTVGLSGAVMKGIHVRGTTAVVVSCSPNAGRLEFCIVESENDFTVVQGLPPTSFYNCLFIGGSLNVMATFVRCIVYSGLGSGAVGSTFYSSNVLGYVEPGIDVSANNFNFSLDPQFCGIPGSGNYFLQSTSPCLGANFPFAPGVPFNVGPLGMGCGTVRVEARTWGSVKALYRNR